jgi:hypothetical protein
VTNYITPADLKQSLELTGTTNVERDIERAIPAASAAIDELCGRRFGQDTAAVARYYDADTVEVCWIDDVMRPTGSTVTTSLTDVLVDTGGNYGYATAWTKDTDYLLQPMNAAADAKPFTLLRAIRRSFPMHSGGVKVTAQYGWAEIPAGVVEACVLLANKLIVRVRQAPFGIVSAGIDSGAVMRIARMDPDVIALLEPYMRNRPFA